jgi:hypothetical protein
MLQKIVKLKIAGSHMNFILFVLSFFNIYSYNHI